MAILEWTHHARAKMRHYGLSESRVKRVLHAPRRVEEGIAPDTIALMQPASVRRAMGTATWTQEVWVMIVKDKKAKRVVSAWRYPGMTKIGEPLPAEIVRELQGFA